MRYIVQVECRVAMEHGTSDASKQRVRDVDVRWMSIERKALAAAVLSRRAPPLSAEFAGGL